MIRKLSVIWLLLCAALLVPRDVDAHAALAESVPAANAVLAEAPATARLKFTEPLEASYSRVVLISAADGPVGTAPSRIDAGDGYAMLLDLPVLSEGVYTLQWRTLSSVDGHTAEGVVPFVIGDPDAANAPLVLPAAPPDPLASPPPANVGVRWLSALSLALLLGSLVFGAALWSRAAAKDETLHSMVGGALQRLTRAAAVFALVIAVGALVVAAIATESNPLSFAFGTRIGLIYLVRIALVAAASAVIFTRWSQRETAALALSCAAMLTISLVSHSAVPQTTAAGADVLGTVLAVAFDLVHLLATGIWLGALPALLVTLLVLRRYPGVANGVAGPLVARYGGLTVAAIIALGATGTIAAVRHIGSLTELYTTTYGRALAIKLALFGLLLLLGAYNRWMLHPRISHDSARTGRTLGRMRLAVGAEILIGALLLLAVGVLTASPPARDFQQTGPNFAETVAVGPATLSLQVVRDATAGDIYAVTVRNLPANVKPEAVLRASMEAHGMAEQELKLTEVEPGRWGARGTLLTMAGPWELEAIVRAIGMSDVRHTFTYDTTPVTEQPPSTTGTPAWLIVLVIACLAVAVSQLPLQTAWRYRFQLSSVGLLVIAFAAAVGPYYLARATEQENPLTNTPEVLAAGKQVYEQSCVSCHGVGGLGDGPAAATLPGLPANFTIPHFATHSDGQLFGWIKSGKPGTAMPAFGENLDDEQIWQVVTYIRQIYADAQP